MAHRMISQIASDICKDWKNVYFGARPYLGAMLTLRSIDDKFGADSADSVVRYFLSNARNYRGENAKRYKAELQAMLSR